MLRLQNKQVIIELDIFYLSFYIKFISLKIGNKKSSNSRLMMSSDNLNNINVPQNTNLKTKSTIKSYLNLLNNTQFEADTKWIKVNDLTVGEKYKIKSAKKIKTKFGESVMVFIKDEDGLTYGLFLPKRFSKLTVKQVNQLETFNITYLIFKRSQL